MFFENKRSANDTQQIVTDEVRSSANTQAQEGFRQIEVETVAEHLSKGGTLSDARETVNAKVGDLRGRGSELQAKLRTAKQEIIANWGAKNKLVTREQYAAADRRIQNRLRAPEGVEYRHSGVPLNNLPDIGIKATFHFEAAAGGFKDFVTAMKPDLAKVGRSPSLSEYEELYRTKATEAGVKPSELEIAKAKLTTRTDAELKADLDPSIRAGETQQQAETRVNEAKAERTDRANLSLYESLGATPKKTNIAANDLQYAQFDKAHTDERHGASVTMRRTDAPAGTRTVEGRLFGDQPWGTRQQTNFSYKWLDDSTMNKTINEYMEKNWNQIREDLVFTDRHKHEAVFDAGKSIGEGFYNKNQMGMGAVDLVYHQTSKVKIVITLDQIEPPTPIVVTAYPAGGGK